MVAILSLFMNLYGCVICLCFKIFTKKLFSKFSGLFSFAVICCREPVGTLVRVFVGANMWICERYST